MFSAGSWGTAFSLVLADAGNDVTLWARREEVVEADQRAPGEHRLPAGHRAAAVDLARPTTRSRPLAGADVVVLAVPSQTLRENLTAWAPVIPEKATLVSLMKGVELGTLSG